jgi:protein-tyrosine phosphatase
MKEGSVFNILVVCLGNICRSPVGELLLEDSLDGTVTVTSAGTGGLPAWPIDATMAEALHERYSNNTSLLSATKAFQSRRLTRQMVKTADLVLAMGSDHREFIVDLDPTALRKTFLFQEFARLATASKGAADIADADRLAGIIARAPSLRANFAGQRFDDEIADPYGLPLDVFRDCLRTISEATAKITS